MNKVKNLKKFFQLNVDVEVNTQIEVTDDFGQRIIDVQMNVEMFILKSKVGMNYEVTDYVSGTIGDKHYEDFLYPNEDLKKIREFFKNHGIDFDKIIDEDAIRTVKTDEKIQTLLRHYEIYMM